MEIHQTAAQNTLSFKVDAGLINRLGRELVGRAETAVSELVKNAYDADAKVVDVIFINTNQIGGTLEVIDDGLGMTLEQLANGYMTISSTDKIHNPKSKRYNRSRAGKKGIGRFATQRLGEKLIIITQTKEAQKAFKLVIDWNQYAIDQDITTINNPLEEVEKTREEGTTLIIESLREAWSTKSIERVYRYVSELLQPDYLSDRSSTLGLATRKDESFKVSFYQIDNGNKEIIADPQKMLFDRALAVIEGFVDKEKDGFYGIKSDSLKIDDYAIPIDKAEAKTRYEFIHDIHFKAYYFIYNRTEYYTNISKLELQNIKSLSQDNSGIRLYRNGFRVLPYGEPTDDWLGLDVRYSGAPGTTNIPFANKNLFGFVEVIDPEGVLFEETASREGLIENEALIELKDFIYKALTSGRARIAEGITKLRKKNNSNDFSSKVSDKEKTENNFKKLEDFVSENSSNANYEDAKKLIVSLKDEYQSIIEELGMLRVLAGLGLTIAEFTHEIIQFTPSINGYINALMAKQNNAEGIELLEKLKRVFKNFTAYTSYFNATVSQNVSRELRPIIIIDVIRNFLETIKEDLSRQNILCQFSIYNYDLITIPMHASEWSSIFFNLYTNSKKAIRRANSKGKIGIIVGEENGFIYIEFTDNGDGIPKENTERIFNAFFTTSTPAGYDAPMEETLTGTGLGLKIVKDILESYSGRIYVIPPETGYSTCFRIEIPKANHKQLEDYGL